MALELPPLAEVSDLEDRLGRPLNDAESARAEAALEDASALVREEARRDFAEGAPPAVQAVVLTSSLRVMRNPEGYVAEQIGSYSYRRKEDDTAVYLTPAEKAIVGRYRQASGTGLWSLGTTRGEPVFNDTMWAEDTNGAELFPLYSSRDFP